MPNCTAYTHGHFIRNTLLAPGISCMVWIVWHMMMNSKVHCHPIRILQESRDPWELPKKCQALVCLQVVGVVRSETLSCRPALGFPGHRLDSNSPFCPFWPLTPNLSKVFSSAQRLLTGFSLLEAILCKNLMMVVKTPLDHQQFVKHFVQPVWHQQPWFTQVAALWLAD